MRNVRPIDGTNNEGECSGAVPHQDHPYTMCARIHVLDASCDNDRGYGGRESRYETTNKHACYRGHDTGYHTANAKCRTGVNVRLPSSERLGEWWHEEPSESLT
jgi:hypothetical protein